MSFAVRSIDHIVITCADVEATARWYVRVLGMTRETYGAGRTALTFGRHKINLRPLDAGPAWETAATPTAGSADVCFVVDATPDEVGEHLRTVGVAIHEGPITRSGALGPITSHYCLDPDGNLIELAVYESGPA